MIKKQHGGIEYLQKGETPALLILSGMHGDESGVVQYVTTYVANHEDSLPDFLFIPKVSPSAVQLNTRINTFGHDVNRNFFDPPTDPEAKAVMEIIAELRFDRAIDFHEDPDLKDEFYMYFGTALTPEQQSVFRQTMQLTGIGLHTGIDDSVDSNLGLHVEAGYICTPANSFPKEAGFSGEWLLDHHVAKQVFTPEIPGQAEPSMKSAVVAGVFSFIRNLPLS